MMGQGPSEHDPFEPEQEPELIQRRTVGLPIARHRRRRIVPLLRRVLGVPALYSTAYGNVGSSIYYALGVTALYALGLTPVVFLAAALLFACTALSYAEGTAAIPEAGGSSSFARHAFNELISLIAGWALMLDYIVTIAISAFTVSNYAAYFYSPFSSYPWNALAAIGLLLFLAVLNVRGVGESAFMNILLAVLDLFTQLFLVLFGFYLLLHPDILSKNIIWGVAPTWGELLYGISIAMIAFTGIETISNMAEEAKDPGRDAPRAVGLVFITVLVLYIGLSVIGLSAMPVYKTFEPYADANGNQRWDQGEPYNDINHNQRYDGTLYLTHLAYTQKYTPALLDPRYKGRVVADPQMPETGFLEEPLIGVADQFPVGVKQLVKPWLAILAVTILIIATNAGLLGVSRLAFSLGSHHQLPPVLSRVHRRYRTPWVAVIFFTVCAALLIAPGRLTFLADLYSFGAMLAFAMAHVSIIALRVRKPDLPRPFKIPFGIRWRGTEIPVSALIGLLGTMATWLIVVISHPWGRLIGFIWMTAGLVMYIIYRKRAGLSLTETVRAKVRGD